MKIATPHWSQSHRLLIPSRRASRGQRITIYRQHNSKSVIMGSWQNSIRLEGRRGETTIRIHGGANSAKTKETSNSSKWKWFNVVIRLNGSLMISKADAFVINLHENWIKPRHSILLLRDMYWDDAAENGLGRFFFFFTHRMLYCNRFFSSCNFNFEWLYYR